MKPLDMREDDAPQRVIPAVRIADATDEVLGGMRDIYYELTFEPGKKDWNNSDLRILRRFLDEKFYGSLKSGGEAKLQLLRPKGSLADEVIGFDYNPNLRPHESGHADGLARAEAFRSKATDLLAEKGVLFNSLKLQF